MDVKTRDVRFGSKFNVKAIDLGTHPLSNFSPLSELEKVISSAGGSIGGFSALTAFGVQSGAADVASMLETGIVKSNMSFESSFPSFYSMGLVRSYVIPPSVGTMVQSSYNGDSTLSRITYGLKIEGADVPLGFSSGFLKYFPLTVEEDGIRLCEENAAVIFLGYATLTSGEGEGIRSGFIYFLSAKSELTTGNLLTDDVFSLEEYYKDKPTTVKNLLAKKFTFFLRKTCDMGVAPPDPAPPDPPPTPSGSLFPKPTDLPTPAKYRFTAYNIPFMRDGEDVFALPKDEIDTWLETCKLDEQTSEGGFRTRQNSVVWKDAEKVRMANYMRVARAGDGDYTTDGPPSYYWVDDVEDLGEFTDIENAAALRLTVDHFATGMFGPEAYSINGRLIQTTLAYPKINRQRRVPFLTPAYEGGKMTFDPIACDEFAVVINATNERGNTLQLILPVTGADISESTALLEQAIRRAGAASAVKITSIAAGSKVNIQVLGISVLPYAWIEELGGLAEDEGTLYTTYTGSEQEVPVYILPVQGTMQNGPKLVADYIVGQNGYFKNVLLKPYSKIIFRTPARFIELTGDPTLTQCNNVKIYIEYADAGGTGSDRLTIYAFLNGEFVDISDDFTADFAVNQQALQQVQQKELVALRTLSSVVGGIGGIVGGVSSGNYFGAVQSAFGAVGSIADLAAARKTPAQLHTGGSVMNAVATSSIVGYLEIEPENDSALEFAETQNGYILPEKEQNFIVNAVPDDMIYPIYVKMEITEMSGIRGGQDANNYIAQRLKNGVRFIRPQNKS